MTLRIASNLDLPDEAVVQTFALLAKRGAGKSYAAAVLAEEMIEAGHCVVILDVVGVFWGLRASADGKANGLPIIIVGGDRGDLPLESAAGALMADTVIETRRPVVLDLSLFSKTEQRRFVTDFAERLYQKNREPLHLIIDEADSFVPQRIMGGDERMFGAIDTIVRRGRARGLGVTLISQRPAVISKDVLTQIEVLIALRMVGPQDRDAIGKWVDVHAEDRDKAKIMLSDLPSLPIGEAWVWSPGWLDIWKRIKVRARRTFDSSSTPKPGVTVARPTKLAPVDLEALRAKMAALVEEKAKADPKTAADPKALRARIADLEAQLAARAPAERVEVPMLTGQEHDLLDGLWESLRAAQGQIELLAKAVGTRAAAAAELPAAPAPPASPVPARLPKTRATSAPTPETSDLNKAERAILQALAQLREATASRLSIVSGYSIRSSSFEKAISGLRTRGLLEGSAANAFKITAAGAKRAGSVPPMPTGPELLSFWASQLNKAERLMLEHIARARRPVTKLELSAGTGYSVSSSSFEKAVSKLRTLSLISGSSEYVAAESFGGGR